MRSRAFTETPPLHPLPAKSMRSTDIQTAPLTVATIPVKTDLKLKGYPRLPEVINPSSFFNSVKPLHGFHVLNYAVVLKLLKN